MGVRAADHGSLAAKAAITEVIYRYCRGMDRMDRALTLSCWHLDGTDDHAPLYSGSAEGFIAWLWPVHAAMEVTRHAVSNIIIALDGDRAGTESYWDVTLRIHQGEKLFDVSGGGRYLDQFECIDGIWAIRHRQSVTDWNRVDPVDLTLADFVERPLIQPNNPGAPETPSLRDTDDYSYRLLGRLPED